jgi:hypothetical protein
MRASGIEPGDDIDETGGAEAVFGPVWHDAPDLTGHDLHNAFDVGADR